MRKDEQSYPVHPERSRVAAKSKDNAPAHSFDVDALVEEALDYHQRFREVIEAEELALGKELAGRDSLQS